jgi:hypothetical protein
MFGIGFCSPKGNRSRTNFVLCRIMMQTVSIIQACFSCFVSMFCNFSILTVRRSEQSIRICFFSFRLFVCLFVCLSPKEVCETLTWFVAFPHIYMFSGIGEFVTSKSVVFFQCSSLHSANSVPVSCEQDSFFQGTTTTTVSRRLWYSSSTSFYWTTPCCFAIRELSIFNVSVVSFYFRTIELRWWMSFTDSFRAVNGDCNLNELVQGGFISLQGFVYGMYSPSNEMYVMCIYTPLSLPLSHYYITTKPKHVLINGFTFERLCRTLFCPQLVCPFKGKFIYQTTSNST